MMERYDPPFGIRLDVDPVGEWVRYDDAVRAVAEAEQRGREAASDTYWDRNEVDALVEQGQRDERARIRAGVKAIDPVEWALNPEPAVLAVIDAGGKSVPRIITADDPEPALRSIVTDLIGDAWQSYLSEGGSVVWASTSEEEFLWVDLLALGPITLIHDAGGES